MAYTDIDNKIVAADIQEKLYQGKSFLDMVINDDAFVNAHQRKVVIPQVGSLPDVVIDSTATLAVQDVSDTHESYEVHSYRTKPILIRDFEDYFTNYNKQESVTREQAAQLKDTYTSHAVYSWAKEAATTTNRILLSSGTNRSASVGTGNRKKVTFSDLLNVKKKLIKDGGEQTPGAYIAIVNSEVYSDIMSLTEVKEGAYRSNYSLDNGSIGEFLGFTFFLRESLPVYTVSGSTATIGSFTQASGNNTSVGCLFFHKNLVRKGMAESVRVYLEVSASKAGVEISSELWAGAHLARSDAKGFVSLVEKT